ncbi:AraC family transcriptional regulator [Streptomyces sp. GC420]|uniref:AraC family transcriptional regulator n=1 Tax=Streptomyces sp. GC420 TaxID=2697568 RepID=UPI001414D0A3|nr:AraC family transcriptional regulator [Streptomyces sp. GC420]NBM18008.1 helix-turn-helix domain-containing protein [Streptomyces sp. GC420]
MDALSGFLDGPRARGAHLLRVSMDPPWSVRIEDEAPLSVMCVARGEARVVTGAGSGTGAGTGTVAGSGTGAGSGTVAGRAAGGRMVTLGPGDLAVARGPDPYTVADDPATPDQAVILPGERCVTPDGTDLSEAMSLGVRTWGNAAEGASVMLVGTYQMRGEISRRLLDALPPLLVLTAREWNSGMTSMLAEEIVRDEPGQEAVLDRLLDLVLISALRLWFSRPEAHAPGWFRALADPVVGQAVRLLQNNPAHPWTVARLAAGTGVSRAALARRFTALVGEPPMAYLTGWRLALAADLLREPDATLGAVARKVGYGSPFALSAAFKREYGVSPQEHRSASPTR